MGEGEVRRGGVATVYISAHYVPERVPFLAKMLGAMLDWPFELVCTTLVLNDPALMQEPAIAALVPRFAARGWTLAGELAAPLDDPLHLTWWANRHLPHWIESARPGRDYFFHLEDDIVLTRENVTYYLSALPVLRPHDLLPGFLRYEVRNGTRFALDPRFPSPARPRLIGGRTWLKPVFPYWAGHILDRDWAERFVRSNAFDRERSLQAHDWEVRERAAMGPLWREGPFARGHRSVLPVDGLVPRAECQIWHAAQNYALDPGAGYGKLRMGEVFAPDRRSWRVRRLVAGRIRTLLPHLAHRLVQP